MHQVEGQDFVLIVLYRIEMAMKAAVQRETALF
ncbi:MAG: hypothetical protein PARBA_03093 [Parabacteroides sp.]